MTGREETRCVCFCAQQIAALIADTLEVVNCLRYLKDYVYVRKRLERGRIVEGIAELFA